MFSTAGLAGPAAVVMKKPWWYAKPFRHNSGVWHTDKPNGQNCYINIARRHRYVCWRAIKWFGTPCIQHYALRRGRKCFPHTHTHDVAKQHLPVVKPQLTVFHCVCLSVCLCHFSRLLQSVTTVRTYRQRQLHFNLANYSRTIARCFELAKAHGGRYK